MRSLLLALSPALVASSFNLTNVYGSHAVLQRDKPLTLWGWSTEPTTISTQWLDGATYSSAPGPGALWLLRLPAQPAQPTPFSLTLASSANASEVLVLEDLLLGDVFLCAGQSNMGAVQVQAMQNASAMVAQAATFTTLRIYQVSGNLQSNVSQAEFPADGLVPWQAPLATGNATLLGFSAVCWIMGTTLQQEHLGASIPIGLLHSSHGGTSIQAWQSPAAVFACGDPSNSWPGSVLYNTNVHPLTIGPASLKGVYYYQGEEDCGIGASESYWRAQWWGCAVQALITDWRTVLGDADLFFVVQQLHAWLHTNDIGLAVFRHAQNKALLLPNVAVSTAFDGGDPAQAMAGSPGGTVHSHFKFIPGRRTAAAFAGALYSLPNVPYLNPAYRDATARSVSNASHTVITVTVRLQQPSVPLVLRGWEAASNSSHCPTERAVNASYCDWFAVQVNDSAQSWVNASVALSEDGQGVVLTAVAGSPGLAALATRNGWSDWPVVTVYSAAGLPLATWNRALNQ